MCATTRALVQPLGQSTRPHDMTALAINCEMSLTQPLSMSRTIHRGNDSDNSLRCGASTEATAGTTERVWAVPLDPQLQAMRDQRERDNVPPLYSMSLAAARTADLTSIRDTGGEPEPVHEVTSLRIPGPGGDLALRLYR